MVLYEYMNLFRNDIYNLFVNTHVRIKIYREFYHGIIYIANEGRHVRIGNYHLYLEMEYNQPNCSNTGVPLVEQGLLVLPEHLSSSRSLVFCEVLCILLFVLFLMAIALSVLRRVTYLDYPFGIFKLS
jgi:hypothetical protein